MPRSLPKETPNIVYAPTMAAALAYALGPDDVVVTDEEAARVPKDGKMPASKLSGIPIRFADLSISDNPQHNPNLLVSAGSAAVVQDAEGLLVTMSAANPSVTIKMPWLEPGGDGFITRFNQLQLFMNTPPICDAGSTIEVQQEPETDSTDWVGGGLESDGTAWQIVAAIQRDGTRIPSASAGAMTAGDRKWLNLDRRRLTVYDEWSVTAGNEGDPTLVPLGRSVSSAWQIETATTLYAPRIVLHHTGGAASAVRLRGMLFATDFAGRSL